MLYRETAPINYQYHMQHTSTP